MSSPTPAKPPIPDIGRRTSEPAVRLDSKDLFAQANCVEIEHDGRVYQLRLTRLNKLILTA